MRKKSKLGAFLIRFSHKQFLTFDCSVKNPQCVWAKQHSQQGFARRDSTVCFSTLLDDGEANVTAYFGSFQADSKYRRVIAVPFSTPGGRVIVSGVLEIYCARLVFLPIGHYLVYCAQWLPDEESEDEHQFIDLFFQQLDKPASQSKILVGDVEIQQSGPLLEEAGEFV